MQINREAPDKKGAVFSQMVGDADEKTKAIIDLLQAANKQLELELSNTRVIARNLIGAQTKLFKSKKQKDQNYWVKAVIHWKDQLIGTVNRKNVKDLPDELQLSYAQINDMIQVLHKELPSVVVDDLAYRFDALVYSLINENPTSIKNQTP